MASAETCRKSAPFRAGYPPLVRGDPLHGMPAAVASVLRANDQLRVEGPHAPATERNAAPDRDSKRSPLKPYPLGMFRGV